MALLLRESDVRELLTMDKAIAAVEDMFRQQGVGKFANEPRRRVSTEGAILNVMFAALPQQHAMGAKLYGVSRSQHAAFAVTLFDGLTGALEALIEADLLGQIRTGAASGVATRHLAREDAAVFAILGAGYQARSQVEAVLQVRAIQEVRVYSRTAERRDAFAAEIRERYDVAARSTASVEEAVRGADIVTTATNASSPLLFGSMLEPGMHLNIMGSNWASRREIDDAAVRRAAVVAVDQLKTAMLEGGDLLPLVETKQLHWDEVAELGQIVAGSRHGRLSPTGITLFKSHGIAAEDIAVAAAIVELARQRGMGQEVDFLSAR